MVPTTGLQPFLYLQCFSVFYFRLRFAISQGFIFYVGIHDFTIKASVFGFDFPNPTMGEVTEREAKESANGQGVEAAVPAELFNHEAKERGAQGCTNDVAHEAAKAYRRAQRKARDNFHSLNGHHGLRNVDKAAGNGCAKDDDEAVVRAHVT